MTPMEQRVLAKPFLKWAGGKTQLLGDLSERLPDQIKRSGVIGTYVEPFVGGGALFFYLRNELIIERACLIDNNRELMVGYTVVQREPEMLIEHLQRLEREYLLLDSEARKAYYYRARELYNRQMSEFDYCSFNEDWIVRASLLLFLNKTCFNGLFRQNRLGEFNVPHGSYKNPTICDPAIILAASKALAGVKLICDDFLGSRPYVDSETLVYFDPPYRPLTETSRFTNYSKNGFTDEDQIRLADYFRELDAKGAYLMLSNSDPKVTNPDDCFFDDLYRGFRIERVYAKRSINCNGNARGEITELIVRNY